MGGVTISFLNLIYFFVCVKMLNKATTKKWYLLILFIDNKIEHFRNPKIWSGVRINKQQCKHARIFLKTWLLGMWALQRCHLISVTFSKQCCIVQMQMKKLITLLPSIVQPLQTYRINQGFSKALDSRPNKKHDINN